jgi:hypothetical protein
MSSAVIIGRRASITVSDPWDFGSACGVGPFSGRISDADSQRVLIILDAPIRYLGEIYSSVTCRVRHEGVSIDNLGAGAPVSVNIVFLPAEPASFDQIVDDQFRKGLAAVGTVRLT